MSQAVGITAVCSASATTSGYCYVPYGGERKKAVYIRYDCFAHLRFKSSTESFHMREHDLYKELQAFYSPFWAEWTSVLPVFWEQCFLFYLHLLFIMLLE